LLLPPTTAAPRIITAVFAAVVAAPCEQVKPPPAPLPFMRGLLSACAGAGMGS
jgi:hypothetical protein